MKYYGGIEGGATHSSLIICDDAGNFVVSATGLGTNHWIVGIPECARRIADIVERAKVAGKIPADRCLDSLGLGLSGCEQESTNQELEKVLRLTYANVADNYTICSDTLISVFTVSPLGGVVLIAGTGSNALLRNPDGSTHTCGGWGHFLGDEGSAWYIAHRALKIIFDDNDKLVKCEYSTKRTWEIIKQHFSVQTQTDMLDHCYAKFEKCFFAALCKKLAVAAENGDELCKFLFVEAGQHIGRSLLALLPNVKNDLVKSGELITACVGSVWKSWHLLREGFLKELQNKPIPFNLHLVRIVKSVAYGAIYIGADSIHFDLPRNYSDNIQSMFYYKT